MGFFVFGGGKGSVNKERGSVDGVSLGRSSSSGGGGGSIMFVGSGGGSSGIIFVGSGGGNSLGRRVSLSWSRSGSGSNKGREVLLMGMERLRGVNRWSVNW